MNKLDNYINWLKERNRSQNTIRIYTEALKKFTQQQAINTDNIRNFLQRNRTIKEANTLKIFRQALSSYSKFKRLKIDWERIVGIIPTVQRKFFATINEQELNQLKQTKTERSPIIHQRNNLILDFFFYSGIRISELVNIKHQDWQGNFLKIHGKVNKVRYIFLPPFLVSQLQATNLNYLFISQNEKPLSDLLIRQMIKKRTKKAGINKNITPHTLRRSFATNLYNKGGKLETIQKQLGHSSVETTMSYIHNDFATLYEDYSKIFTNTQENYAQI